MSLPILDWLILYDNRAKRRYEYRRGTHECVRHDFVSTPLELATYIAQSACVTVGLHVEEHMFDVAGFVETHQTLGAGFDLVS
jgi:hypothetical protein